MNRRDTLRLVFPLALTFIALLSMSCDDGGGQAEDVFQPELDQSVTPDVQDEELDTAPPPCLCAEGQCGTLECGTECGVCGSDDICRNNYCVTDCTFTGFTALEEQAAISTVGDTDLFVYKSQNSKTGVTDSIVVEHRFDPATGPIAPGIYPLAYAKASECEVCVTMLQGVTASGYETMLIPTEGEIEITTLDPTTGRFDATIRGAVFKEIAFFTKSTYLPFVKDGLLWCQFETTLGADIASTDACIPWGTGRMLDDNVADFSLQNCAGDWINLHDSCGTQKAVWMVATAGWCPACKEYMPQVQAAYEANKALGLEVWYVYGENDNYAEPTMAECVSYAKRSKLPLSRVFLDPSWDVVYSKMDPYLVDGGLLLPWDGIMDGKNMRYKYASTSVESQNAYPDINGPLTELLGQ